MREVISIQYGGCGLNVGHKFWKTICKEHGVNLDGSMEQDVPSEMISHLDVHFSETQPGKFHPRAVLVDNDPTTIEETLKSDLGQLYDPNFMFNNLESADTNFAKGMYCLEKDVVEPFLDTVRKEADCSELLHGFMNFCGIGGGTGSGLMSN